MSKINKKEAQSIKPKLLKTLKPFKNGDLSTGMMGRTIVMNPVSFLHSLFFWVKLYVISLFFVYYRLFQLRYFWQNYLNNFSLLDGLLIVLFIKGIAIATS